MSTKDILVSAFAGLGIGAVIITLVHFAVDAILSMRDKREANRKNLTLCIDRLRAENRQLIKESRLLCEQNHILIKEVSALTSHNRQLEQDLHRAWNIQDFNRRLT
jgi:signal transduction protein with GAF and PtsI domain